MRTRLGPVSWVTVWTLFAACGDTNRGGGAGGALGMPLEYSGTGDTGTGWPHRPVGIEIDGRLFVTSDDSGMVIAIGHNGA